MKTIIDIDDIDSNILKYIGNHISKVKELLFPVWGMPFSIIESDVLNLVSIYWKFWWRIDSSYMLRLEINKNSYILYVENYQQVSDLSCHGNINENTFDELSKINFI
jgi:hypothetical protein